MTSQETREDYWWPEYTVNPRKGKTNKHTLNAQEQNRLLNKQHEKRTRLYIKPQGQLPHEKCKVMY